MPNNLPDIDDPQIQRFIDRFLETSGRQDVTRDTIVIDIFGDSPQLADSLLALVLAGIKTATCMSLWEWEHDNDVPLQPGMLSIICDGAGTPRCVLETKRVEQLTYQDVTADFARAEGEHEPLDLQDELVLEHWRTYHWAYFIRALGAIGRTPSMDMPVLCEHFTVLYAEDVASRS
jgi:uncharacterized protein YhfF